jgi:putative intracellular protease/amidase
MLAVLDVRTLRSFSLETKLTIDSLLAMFDLVDNSVSINLIQEFYDTSRIVTVLCHGAAPLVNVTLANGSHLLDGEKVTGFSNQEEIDVDRQKDMPFHLEDTLNKASGGHY